MLKSSLFGSLGILCELSLSGCGSGDSAALPPPAPPPDPIGYGPLGSADSNGVRLPAGFSSRVIARSGEEPLVGSGYLWHGAPDGGATFPTQDGGWIYVSNAELDANRGGVGAIRFDSDGNIVSVYSVLSSTSRNCAGGPTPWGTWLSCEEFGNGYVWECDPFGGFAAQRKDLLGRFQHEAAAVDPDVGAVYLTEDRPDGCFYRYLPGSVNGMGIPNLDNGLLQVAQVVGGEEGGVIWHDIDDPVGAMVETRFQVAEATQFNRGEGLWYSDGGIYMATTGDNRIWKYDTGDSSISIIYDDDFFTDPVLQGVDNITFSPSGNLYVAEDAAQPQLMLIAKDGNLSPLVELAGHDDSEIAGPAFDPSGSRLYFSSQKGTSGLPEDGVTFEVSGPII